MKLETRWTVRCNVGKGCTIWRVLSVFVQTTARVSDVTVRICISPKSASVGEVKYSTSTITSGSTHKMRTTLCELKQGSDWCYIFRERLLRRLIRKGRKSQDLINQKLIKLMIFFRHFFKFHPLIFYFWNWILPIFQMQNKILPQQSVPLGRTPSPPQILDLPGYSNKWQQQISDLSHTRKKVILINNYFHLYFSKRSSGKRTGIGVSKRTAKEWHLVWTWNRYKSRLIC